jgi:siderophore synthetase component
MDAITKDELKNISEKSKNPLIQSLASQKLKDEFKGDEVAQKMIQLSQLLTQVSQGANIDENEVRRIVREEIETDKISFDDLDETVKTLLKGQQTNVTLTVKQGTTVKLVQRTLDLSVTRPLIQKILSDVLARNNVYLYGGA